MPKTRPRAILGHEPITACDGTDARNKFLAEWFPVIITDWEMPEMSGIELCRQVRSADLPIYTYILFLTSKQEKQHLIEALAAGVDDFVSKPFNPHELQARLGAAERIVRLEADLRQGGLSAGSCSCCQRFVSRFLRLGRATCAPRLPLCGSLRLAPSVPAGSFHPARISPCWAHWRGHSGVPCRRLEFLHFEGLIFYARSGFLALRCWLSGRDHA